MRCVLCGNFYEKETNLKQHTNWKHGDADWNEINVETFVETQILKKHKR